MIPPICPSGDYETSNTQCAPVKIDREMSMSISAGETDLTENARVGNFFADNV